MYNKIPAEIKPTYAFAKIMYASAFDLDLCLLLREKRATSLGLMQYAALEVESKAVNRLRNKVNRDIPRGRFEASTFGSSTSPPQVDEVTKLL